MISVALCTYNGEKFLTAQLESIKRQTLLPDEIIFGDDGSTDNTLSLLTEYKVHFEELGIKTSILPPSGAAHIVTNFERTLQATQGGIIFLSDQDDVWHEDRISQSVFMLENNPEVLLLHGDAELIDKHGHKLPQTLFEKLKYSHLLQNEANSGAAFDLLLQRNLVTGATAVIRRELLSDSIPFSQHWLHDEWLAIIAAAKNGYFVVQDELISYRLHDDNSVGLQKRSIRGLLAFFFASRRGRYEQLIDRLSEIEILAQHKDFKNDHVEKLRRAIQFNISRKSYPKQRLFRFPQIWKEAVNGNYRDFSARPVVEMLRDFLQSA